jgi:predicted DNA-binding antitoxin AbrB/MazE fold protein
MLAEIYGWFTEGFDTKDLKEARKRSMRRTIRAKVRGEVLQPLEELALAEGEEVTITVDVPSKEDDERFWRSAGGWKGLVDAEKLKRRIYRDRLLQTRMRPRL